MTIRNLDHVFKPKSVVLIGASQTRASVGNVVARNLSNGGFQGLVLAVNPKYQAVEGIPCHADIASLPSIPDLAIICTPPATVPGIVGALGARGTRAAVVITTGFGQGAGAELKQAMLEAAKPFLLRLIGPNCLGVMVPGIGLNASFSHVNPVPGRLAFIAQSGAIVTAIVDWARARGIGFSHLVSLGDMAAWSRSPATPTLSGPSLPSWSATT